MAKTHSTRKRATGKPAKPTPDFPLFPHATKRWAKKIRGRLHYLGPWDDPDGALQKYLTVKDDLHAGRTPRGSNGQGLTVRNLCNRFLTSKRILVDSGELNARTWQNYFCCCERLIQMFGRNRLVSDLAADDFERLRVALSKALGPVTLKVHIQRIRTVFKYA